MGCTMLLRSDSATELKDVSDSCVHEIRHGIGNCLPKKPLCKPDAHPMVPQWLIQSLGFAQPLLNDSLDLNDVPNLQIAGLQRSWAALWQQVHGDLGQGRAMSVQELVQPFTFHYQRLFLLLHGLQEATPGLAVRLAV